MRRNIIIIGWLVLSAVVAWAADDASVEMAFLQGQSAVVAQQCAAERLPQRLLPNEEHACLLSVRALIQQRELVGARERIALLQERRVSSEGRAALQLALADSYFLEGNWIAAQQAYQTAVEQARRTPLHPLATYGLARATQYQGDLPRALVLFADVIRAAPWSFEAESAREIVNDDAHLAVQVGSFHDRTNAVRLLKDLQRQGYQSYLHEVAVSGQTHFRVRVGRFNAYAEAKRMHDELNRLGYATRIYP